MLLSSWLVSPTNIYLRAPSAEHRVGAVPGKQRDARPTTRRRSTGSLCPGGPSTVPGKNMSRLQGLSMIHGFIAMVSSGWLMFGDGW